MTMIKLSKMHKSITLETLKNYYWLRSELVSYCKKFGLSTTGVKENLLERLENYIKTGEKTGPIKTNHTKQRDSDKTITLTTKVMHYKNDAATRDFFIAQIG